jgi:phosphoglycolate phosphatase-like HAD superfamily hydrolase
MEFEAIIFDIDGVLVDVRKSYNGAIIKTVQIILQEVFDIKNSTNYPYEDMISKLRNTGGFNNDIDTTYAIILILLYCVLIKKMDTSKTIQMFEDIIEKLDEKGKDSLEKELERDSDIQNIKEKLNYPYGTEDIISSRFNEIFYGSELFKEQFKREPMRYFDARLIDKDIVIIKEETVKLLSQKFSGNLGLISGRSKVASYFTLGKLVKYFNEDACVFLEDEKREYSKPNTFSLHRVFDKLNLKNALYVGDSMADLLMVENFREETNKNKIFFCGIYGEGDETNKSIKKDKFMQGDGVAVIIKNSKIKIDENNIDIVSTTSTSNNTKKVHGSFLMQNKNRLTLLRKELFESKNADIIIENVNDLPNILNITKN